MIGPEVQFQKQFHVEIFLFGSILLCYITLNIASILVINQLSEQILLL